jgi:subtilisin family serine protease
VTLLRGTDINAFDAAHRTSMVGALPDGQTYVLKPAPEASLSRCTTALRSDPSVLSVESNAPLDLLAAEKFYLAADKFYLGADGSTFPITAQNQWALSTVEATAALSISQGAGITVAVIDTGVDPTHPALAGHIAQGGYDYISQTATISDVAGGGATGHGTFIAGLIAQLAPQALILPFRVLDPNGYGTVANVAQAIETATNEGARVINLSMGTQSPSPTLLQAILYAQMHNVLVVASGGNDASTVPQYPAGWAGWGTVMSVAGTDQHDKLAAFSNYGPWITVSAPAVDLVSTYPGGYADGSGTSFAAPLAAAEAALVLAAHPSLNAQTASAKIAQYSVDVSDNNPGFDGLMGEGRIDAGYALQSLVTWGLPATRTPRPTATPSAAPATGTPVTATSTPSAAAATGTPSVTTATDTALPTATASGTPDTQTSTPTAPPVGTATAASQPMDTPISDPTGGPAPTDTATPTDSPASTATPIAADTSAPTYTAAATGVAATPILDDTPPADTVVAAPTPTTPSQATAMPAPTDSVQPATQTPAASVVSETSAPGPSTTPGDGLVE